jgi:hypothetical protein
VRDELADILSEHLSREFILDDEIEVRTEEKSTVPHCINDRIPDILIEFNDTQAVPDRWTSQIRGCAFEIKTGDEQTERGAHQLYRDSVAGYQPIMVTPGWRLIKQRGVVPSYEWFVEFFDHGCALEIVSGDPLRFTQSAIPHCELALPGFRKFLMRTERPL